MNMFRLSFVFLYIIQAVFFAGLEVLNLRHLRRQGPQVPEAFRGFIDAALFQKISEYTREKTALGLSHEVVAETALLAMIVSGFLVGVDGVLSRSFQSFSLRGLLFFFVPGLLLYLIGLPFAYRHTFVIEAKYGFNRTTPGRWVMDHLKAGFVSLVILAPLLLLVLWLVRNFPGTWWALAFMAISLIQVLIAVLYPRCIAPLFNRFEPIRDGEMTDKVRDLMERNDIQVKRILEMDAGVRSRHTNAYFTGLGKTKQIVLFDTLLEAHPHDEILAVLAHEVGHFKGKHILKQLAVSEAGLLLGFYLTGRLLEWPSNFAAFGFDTAHVYTGLFLLAVFWQKAGAFFLPLFMALSRRFEREADSFAARMLGTAGPLVTAFKRMAAHNLSNLKPHPLYVAFHYSHPPLAERIALLESVFGRASALQDTHSS